MIYFKFILFQGRLGDLMQRKCFRTDDIEIICLDEADELLKKSFIVSDCIVFEKQIYLTNENYFTFKKRIK